MPSIFFIKNGIPIKIITETVKTVKELEEAIDAITKSNSAESQPQQQQPAAGSSSTATKTAGESEVVCDGDTCYQKPKEAATEPSVDSKDQNETEAEKQEKVKKAMKLIEQKRIERIQEEQRLEKERELQRRKVGQDLQDLKKWQNDQELEQIKADRLRDKAEAKAARQRVLDQIAEDKKERAQRFGMQTAAPTEPKASPVTPPTPSAALPNSTRIQFKKPDGESEVVTFDSDMLFADVHLFVKNDILHGAMSDFTLATSFPRREYSQEDFDKTLASLNLIPSAVLLILPKRLKPSTSSGPSSILPTQTDGSFIAMMGALITGVFSPVMALFAYLKTFLNRAQGPTESANDAGKRKRNEDVLAPNDA